MSDLSAHLAPNAPWLLLLALTLIAAGLSVWAYRFAVPRLPAGLRNALAVVRWVALAALLWLLAQPVLERATDGDARIVVLLDRSRSMDLPAGPDGSARAGEAAGAVRELERAWRGRARVEVLPFGADLAPDSARTPRRDATALGTALATLAATPAGERASGVVVVSDGVVNAGEDPIAAARGLGLPVHAVVVGQEGLADRAVAEIEASSDARVGRATPVRVRVATTEPRGVAMRVRLLDEGRAIGTETVVSPGGGAEVTAEFRPIPSRPGLAVWTAEVDSIAGEATRVNNARQVAVPVSPGRLGVTFVSAGLNWDLAFLRRALRGDSSLALATYARDRQGWSPLDGTRGALGPAALRGQAVLVLDAVVPADVSPAFDQAVAEFVRQGGAVLVLGGPLPGASRYREGRLGQALAFELAAGSVGRTGPPAPTPEGRELVAWDDDPGRGARAWEAAAPLTNVVPLTPGPGDRVLIVTSGGGPPLVLLRRVGRGKALIVNGTGIWRWSLSGHDDLGVDRTRRLWRGLVRWIAEPVQGEPLRVRPDRWLTAGGETLRLFATLQDSAFRPVAQAAIEGEVRGPAGAARRIAFEGGGTGSYTAALDDLPPGRYRVTARATRNGRELGRAGTEFAVDRWSLELARTHPDSALLASVAAASGGRVTEAGGVRGWARDLGGRALARGRVASLRLWESPWVFAVVVGLLSVEWVWRRRRGLP